MTDKEIIINTSIEEPLEFTIATCVSDFSEWDYVLNSRCASLYTVSQLKAAITSGEIERLCSTAGPGKGAVFFIGEWFNKDYQILTSPYYEVSAINHLKGQNDSQFGSPGGQIISYMYQNAFPFIACNCRQNCTTLVENFLTNGTFPAQPDIIKLPLPPFETRNPYLETDYSLRYAPKKEVRIEQVDYTHVCTHELRLGEGSYCAYLDKLREDHPFLGILCTRPLLTPKDNLESKPFEARIKQWANENNCRFVAVYNETFSEQVLVKMAEQLWGNFKAAAIERAFSDVSL